MLDKNGFIDTDKSGTRVCVRTKDEVIFTYDGKIDDKALAKIEWSKENIKFPNHRFDRVEFVGKSRFIMIWKPINA